MGNCEVLHQHLRRSNRKAQCESIRERAAEKGIEVTEGRRKFYNKDLQKLVFTKYELKKYNEMGGARTHMRWHVYTTL